MLTTVKLGVYQSCILLSVMYVNPELRSVCVQCFDTWYTTKEVSGACGQGLALSRAQTAAQASRRRRTFKNAGMEQFCYWLIVPFHVVKLRNRHLFHLYRTTAVMMSLW